MKTKKLSLKAYSALSFALLTQTKAEAQVVITDFEPDLRMMNWEGDDDVDSLKIDFDGNGIDDLIFHYDEHYFYPDVTLEIADAVEGFYLFHIYSGDTIDNYLDWFTIGFEIADASLWVSGYSWYINYGGHFDFLSGYMGLKLNFDDGVHFGWLRLMTEYLGDNYDSYYWDGVGSPLVVYEYGYEETPNTPIVCQAVSLVDRNPFIWKPRLIDNNDADDFSQFYVEFSYGTGSDSINFSELRVFLVPDIEQVINFSVETALSLSPDRYTGLSADSVSFDEDYIYLNSFMKDINGNEYIPDTYYSAFILRIPKEGDVMNPLLSAPLPIKKAELQNCFLEIENLDMTYSSSENTFTIYFDKDADDSDLSGYFVGILPDDVFYHSYDEVEYDLLSESGYVYVPKTSDSSYIIELSGISNDMYGNPFIGGVEYDPVIVGVGDGYYRDLMCYTFSNSEYILSADEVSGKDVIILQSSPEALEIFIPESMNDAYLELCDIQGRVIETEKISSPHQIFSFPSLPNGIYIATVKENDVPVAVAKVILQH